MTGRQLKTEREKKVGLRKRWLPCWGCLNRTYPSLKKETDG